ncbi:MAG: Ig-like domain-containing protein, partial [Spirochaetia bacterium]|nr:Ig-like domain-containing protein [Spirochaetia bacterium]
MVFESCDVGLGESVDTIPPTISITYPPTSSVIRDAFVVSGTWVDDKGVSLVKLTLKNEETGETVASRFAGIGIGTWNTSFNVASKDESGKLIYPIPDGKYTISVTAMDLSGRISATSYRSIEIDNTAPVFVI